jgi:spoIIIJ-associated protein
MTQEKTTLEIIAPSIEEAVAKGLSQLGLSRDAVDVEVLDTGSKGLFGLGSRQARIRLTIRPQNETSAQPQEKPRALIETSPVEEVFSAPVKAVEPTAVKGTDDNALQVAEQVVMELLEKMRVNATVTAQYIQPEESGEQSVILVDIQGNDLSILIGRRSETLNALQYISSLIIGKELGRWTPMMIDVQGYRVRREHALRQLAQRMAEQAIHTGRKQVLEPMPPAERRVIHIELRNPPQVATESLGEEPNRKVTIFLKK